MRATRSLRIYAGELSLKFIHHIAEGIPIPVYGDGTQERDFTYVDDIARGSIAYLKPLGFEVINLGSDRPVNVKISR